MKVRDVKKVAQEECNIEPEHMRLIYNSRQLKDWDTLESYKGRMSGLSGQDFKQETCLTPKALTSDVFLEVVRENGRI